MATQPKPDESAVEPPANDAEPGDEQHQEPAERDFEAEARGRGWAPKEEFKGDPARWVDAETFIERTDTVMPLLKADRDRLKRELGDLKRQFKQFSKFASAAEERVRGELQAKMEEAVQAGDVEGFKRLQKEAGELPGAESGQPRHSKEEALEAFEAFRDENPWYDRGNLAGASEIEMNARVYADRITEKRLAALKPGEEPPPEEFFGEIAAEVKAKYPQLGVNGTRQPRAKPASDVAAPGQGRPPRNNRTYDALPAEAKAQCDKWIASGVIAMGSTEKGREFYVKNFDWNKWQQEAAR